MNDSNKSFKDGWNTIFQNRLLNEAHVPMSGDNDDDSDDVSRIHDIKVDLADLKKKKSAAIIQASNAVTTFNDMFPNLTKGTRSIGDSHYSITNFDDALAMFSTPEGEKVEAFKSKYPEAWDGNSLLYQIFLNDYKAKHQKDVSTNVPQGSISQKPSDPNYRKPNTVYNQPHLQAFANEKMMPLLTVCLAGKEHLKELELDPMKEEIFQDPLVKLFMNGLKSKVVLKKVDNNINALETELKDLSQPVAGYKQPKAPVVEPEPVEPSAPLKTGNAVGQKAGPGRIQQESIVTEQTETAEDVVNRNRKALNENWSKYKEKNKDVKNTERPDDLTLLMG